MILRRKADGVTLAVGRARAPVLRRPTLKLNTSRDIPFDNLVLSQSNVRRIKAGVSIEELAEDRACVLGSAQRRSGRAFRRDVRQRVIVKALVSRPAGGPCQAKRWRSMWPTSAGRARPSPMVYMALKSTGKEVVDAAGIEPAPPMMSM